MFYNEESLKRAERVEELCKLTNATPLEITLAYLYAQPFQVIPIVGPCRVKELEESLRASEKNARGSRVFVFIMERADLNDILFLQYIWKHIDRWDISY